LFDSNTKSAETWKELYQNLPEQPEENYDKPRIWSGFELGTSGIYIGFVTVSVDSQ
jgi:hypothetical protein